MIWQFTPLAIALLASSAFSLLLAFILLKRGGEKAARYLGLALVGVFLWMLTHGLEVGAVIPGQKIFFAKLAGIGISVTPVFLFMFGLEYARLGKWLTRRNTVLLFAIPLASIMLVFCNESHHLIWSAVIISPDPEAPFIRYEKGLWYWVNWAYLNTLIILTVLMLLQTVWRFQVFYRKQALLIVFCTLPPWLAYVVYVLNPQIVKNTDLTPFCFLLACLLLTIGIYRFDLLDIMPVSREIFFEGVREGILFVDKRHRIVDMNHAAEQILDLPAHRLLGSSMDALLPSLPGMAEKLETLDSQTFELIPNDTVPHHIEAKITRLRYNENEPNGIMISLQDVTTRKLTEEYLRLSEERYQAIVEEQVDLVCRWQPDDTLSFVNRAFCDYFSITREEAMLDKDASWIVPEVRSLTRYAVRRIVEEKDESVAQEEWNFDREGNLRWVTWVYRPIRDAQGSVLEVQASGRDITDRVRAEDAEREQRMLAESLSEIAKALNSTLDIDRVLDLILSSLEEVIPYEAADLMLIESGKAFINRWHRAPARENPAFLMEFRLKIEETPTLLEMDRSGEPLIIRDVDRYPGWVRAANTEWIRSYMGAPLKLGEETIGFIVLTSSTPGFFHPIHAQTLKAYAEQATVAMHNARLYSQLQNNMHELRKAETEILKAKEIAEEKNLQLQKALADLELAATTDKLTGAYNRRKFDEMIVTEINRAQRYALSFGLILLDVDHFKLVNDHYGHSIGDQALIDLGRIICENIRATDTLTRWGGEEFIILAPGIGIDQTLILAEKVRNQVERSRFRYIHHLTLSMGVTCYHPNDTLDSMIKRADDALYKAKRAGRNCVVTGA